EALSNIFAKCFEIAGIQYGIWLFMAGVFLLFTKRKEIAGRMLIIGILLAVLGFAMPGILVLIANAIHPGDGGVAEILFWAITIIGLIVLIPAYIVTYFLPSIIAFKRTKDNRTMLVILNVVSLIVPFAWSAAFAMACVDN